MRDWLVAECDVFGFAAQNWMWVLAAAFLVYAVSLVLTRLHFSNRAG